MNDDTVGTLRALLAAAQAFGLPAPKDPYYPGRDFIAETAAKAVSLIRLIDPSYYDAFRAEQLGMTQALVEAVDANDGALDPDVEALSELIHIELVLVALYTTTLNLYKQTYKLIEASERALAEPTLLPEPPDDMFGGISPN